MPARNKKQRLKFFWFMVTVLVLKIRKTKIKHCNIKIFLSYSIFALSSSSYVWNIIWTIYLYHDQETFLTGLLSVLNLMCGMITYYLLLLKRKSILSMKKCLTSFVTHKNKSILHCFFYVLMTISILLPSMVSIMFFYIMMTTGVYNISDNYYTFNYSISDLGSFGWIVFFVNVYGVYTIQITLPVICNSIYCILCLEVKDIIIYFTLKFRKLYVTENLNQFSESMKEYNLARQIVEKLHDLFFSISFFMIFNQIVLLFYALNVLLEPVYELDIAEIFEICQIFVQSISLFIATIICSSVVLKEQEECKSLISKIYAYESFTKENTNSDLTKRLKFLMQQKPIALSACGFFQIKRGLFFAVILSVISYGTLLMQMFKEAIKS